MAKAAAETGAGPTVLVAIEQYFPQRERIIDDDLAGKILPSGRALLPIAKSSLIRNWMIRVSEKGTPVCGAVWYAESAISTKRSGSRTMRWKRS